MRVDALPPRTWLLATLAAWAVLVWVLSLFGMGNRITPLPADPDLVPRLPVMAAEAKPRIGPASQYAEAATRPAFSPDRRPHPFFIEGNGEQASGQAFDLVLNSVLIAPGLQMVILEPSQGGDPLRVKLGEEPKGLPGWRLSEVMPRSAVFDGPEGRRTLELRVYTGGLPVPPPPAAAASEPGATPAPGPRVPAPMPHDATTPAANANTTVVTPEQQMQQIRARIEARRAQLRQQQQQAAPQPGASKPLSPPPER